MRGTVAQINVSPGGLPKRLVAEGRITEVGIEGDAHAHPDIHGGPDKALLLIASETVEELSARGYPVFFGALGENITTRGIPVRDLRLGARLRIGEALVELTKPRGPCSALRVYGDSLPAEVYDARVKALDASSPRWGMSGFYARVLSPGVIRTNDIIIVEATFA